MKYILDGKEVSLEELNNAVNNTECTHSGEEVIVLSEIKDGAMIFETGWVDYY